MSSIKPDSFYDLRFLGNINSVSGKIYFEIFRPLNDGNRYESGIYRLDGERVVRYTGGNEDRDMVADSKGELAIYSVKKDKKSTIFVKSIKEGEERKLWETELEIKKIEWSRDSRGLYLITKDRGKDEDFRIMESYPIYFNGEGFQPATKQELIYLDLRGRTKSLVKEKFEIIDFAVNPVEDEVAVVTRPENYGIYKSKIGILSLHSLKISYLDVPRGSYEDPGYFDDGTLFFLMGLQSRSLFESPKLAIWENGKIREMAKDQDISLSNSVNSDSRMGKTRLMKAKGDFIYLIATVSGRAGIYRVKRDGGTEIEPFITGDFSVDSFDFLGDKAYLIAQNSYTPQEIYTFDGNLEVVTSINRRIENRNLRKPENFNFSASDGTEIEGWLLKGNGKGTVIEIHGGPRTSYGEGFIFEFHLLNSLGFNVLFSNPRGSDSYGDDFALTIREKYGERDYEDIMELFQFAKKKYRIDGRRVGVIGGSYGGFMVNWIVGHTDIFKAAVTDRSISDQVSFYFSSDIGPEFNGDQTGGTPYENFYHFWEKSPLKHMKNCKTPLLIVHSEEDFRCPIWQAYELFTQLKLQGNRARMISFKGENHDLSRGGKPKNRVKRLEEISNWFSENLSS